MNNIIAFQARSGSSGSPVEIQESQLAGCEVQTAKTQYPIDFGDLLKLPLDQWPAKLDEIENHLRSLNDPRTQSLEEALQTIRGVSTYSIEALRTAANTLTNAYDAIVSSRGDGAQPDMNKRPPR
jgi:hypothetical protein